MIFYKKLSILLVLIFSILLSAVILHYETNPQPNFIGDQPKTYTAQDIRNMIKKLPNYQGDSLLIDEDGKLTSLDGMIQSTLIQVYIVKVNIDGVKAEAKKTGLPEAYLVYKTGIQWYIDQYGSQKRDSVELK